MGREVALWLDDYLGEEGFRLMYMSPGHRPRELMAASEWRDLCQEGDVVTNSSTRFTWACHKEDSLTHCLGLAPGVLLPFMCECAVV